MLLAALCPGGCLSGRGGMAPPVLAAGPWSLVELGGHPVMVTDQSCQPTLLFDAAGGRVSGRAGVNRFTGGLTPDGDLHALGPAATTRMAGPPNLMQLVEGFLAVLPQVKHWRLEGSWLVLLSHSGAVLARRAS